jgi:hypothetical protein
MQGQHWAVRTDEQREAIINEVRKRPLPFHLKMMEPHSPKTLKQIRYAHSMCNALAAYKQADPEAAKRDAKVAFGIVTVCTSLITGGRSARLKSFADYTRDEMMAFIQSMEVYLDENQIPFTRSEDA